MSLPRSLVPVLAVLIVTGSGIGLFLWRQHADREDRVEARLAAMAIELERPSIDRQSLQNEIRPLRELIAELGPRNDLQVALAQAELALGRPNQALAVLRDVNLDLATDPTLLATAARARAALQAVSGHREEAAEAAFLAERSHRLESNPALLMLAWQCSRRADRMSDAERHAKELIDHHADSVAGKVVAALTDFETRPDKDVQNRLQKLELEFPVPPPELTVALATFQIEEYLGSESKAGDGNLLTAHARLKSALEQHPTSVAGRSAMAVACHALKRQAERDGHLRWLLTHARQDDVRRDQWTRLLQVPVH